MNLEDHYQRIQESKIPKDVIFQEFDYRSDEISRFEVLLFHRLLKEHYGPPDVIDFEHSRISENGILRAIPTEWSYTFHSNEGFIIQVRAIDLVNTIKIGLLQPSTQNSTHSEQNTAVKRFINNIIDELNRRRNELLPNNELRTAKHYMIENLYLHSINNAKFIAGIAIQLEEKLNEEILRYDVRNGDVRNDYEKMEHFDYYLSAKGALLLTMIIYLFQALEGFVNLIYYISLPREFSSVSSSGLKFDKKIQQMDDFEMKILLMPKICEGFDGTPIEFNSEIMERFRKLREYRNQVLHSDVTKINTRPLLVEDGFFYQIFGLDNLQRQNRIPRLQILIKPEHVKEAENMVDDLVQKLLSKTKSEFRESVEKYILKESHIPIFIDEEGNRRLGLSKSD